MCHEPTTFWGKLTRSDPNDQESLIVAWHPLADHCADVAACFEALLELPGYRRRAEFLLGAPITPTHFARLSLIAFLHDIGKGNAGFQSKVFPQADRHRSAPRGHLQEAGELLTDRRLLGLAIPRLRVADMEGWFAEEDGGEFGVVRMLIASWSHHGTPLAQPVNQFDTMPSGSWATWRWSSPEATLDLFREAMDANYGAAFEPAPPMVATPRFQAFFAGLLMLADWLGSSEDWFTFSKPGDGPRLPWARIKARALVASMGLDADQRRVVLSGRPGDFSALFGIDTPNAMQRAMMSLPLHGVAA